jgi:hypothetical protein
MVASLEPQPPALRRVPVTEASVKLELDQQGHIRPDPRFMPVAELGDTASDRARKYRLAQAATLIQAAEGGDPLAEDYGARLEQGTSVMDLLSTASRCPKCSGDASSRFHQIGLNCSGMTGPHTHHKCEDCGFSWGEPANGRNTEPV